jgi:carboxyl-terminal processing protease
MPKSFRILVLAVSVGVVLTAFVGANSSRVSAASDPQEGAYKQMQVYSEVLQHVQSDYVEDPNMSAVTNGALRGLLESLDSNSSYLTAAEYKTYKDLKPGRGLVGMTVAKRYGYGVVVSVTPNGPADKAGLSDGDILESIGDKSSRDLSLATIEEMLQGEPGSTLTVSVVRPRKAAPDRLTLTRANLSLPATSEIFYEQATILYLKPATLDKEHVQQIEQKLKAMGRTSTKKILLDLRDVSTGDTAEGLRLANMFIKTGTLAMLEGQKVQKQTFTADPGKAVNTTAPMVTLVNRGTAGAAELVAGALADAKRSDLVGEKTFGDASQVKTFELPDGAALILSIAKYETPSGKKLQDEGVTPGVLVASAPEDATDDGDDDEDATVTPQAQPKIVQKSSAKIDDQLSKALDLLKSKQA